MKKKTDKQKQRVLQSESVVFEIHEATKIDTSIKPKQLGR